MKHEITCEIDYQYNKRIRCGKM